MLTIERNRNLSLKLHQREKFWSKTLLSALFLAISLHLSAFLLFKVKPISATKSTRTLPPISVVMEPSGIDMHDVTAFIADAPLPQYSLPSRPEENPAMSPLKIDTPLSTFTSDDKFLARNRKNDLYLPPVSSNKTYSLSMLLLGKLSQRRFVEKIDNLKLSSFSEKKTATYEVIVDDCTGSIIWIAPADELGLMISEIKLNQLPRETVTKGILEVQVK
jgi:hypothetical protein